MEVVANECIRKQHQLWFYQTMPNSNGCYPGKQDPMSKFNVPFEKNGHLKFIRKTQHVVY
jgi:hypothetical protein